MTNTQQEEHVAKFIQIIENLNKSREYARRYQESQRALDRELNPRFYNKFLTSDGVEIMVEKPEILSEWS